MQQQPFPIISGLSAFLISLSFSIIYVGSLYLSNNARLSFVSEPHRAKPGREDEEREKMKNERWRDDPDVIRARLTAVSVATVVCCLSVFVVLLFYHVGSGAVKACYCSCIDSLVILNLPFYFYFIFFQDVNFAAKYTLIRLGFLPSLDLSGGLVHLVTPLLFLGPLFCSCLRQELPFQRNWMWETHISARYLSVHGLRNYWIVSKPFSRFFFILRCRDIVLCYI